MNYAKLNGALTIMAKALRVEVFEHDNHYVIGIPDAKHFIEDGIWHNDRYVHWTINIDDSISSTAFNREMLNDTRLFWELLPVDDINEDGYLRALIMSARCL